MSGPTSALVAVALLVAAAWLENQSQNHAGAAGMALQDRDNLPAHAVQMRDILNKAAGQMFFTGLGLGARALAVAFCAGLVAGLAL